MGSFTYSNDGGDVAIVRNRGGIEVAKSPTPMGLVRLPLRTEAAAELRSTARTFLLLADAIDEEIERPLREAVERAVWSGDLRATPTEVLEVLQQMRDEGWAITAPAATGEEG
ncbi:hypothetical protein [Cellulomonas sp. SG140]|uniref:hypothetical protein n=1 Tax=Cellulomonas sp. SG140 TaxID=2976536 RepID=UPI0021E89EAD|nr:hypothetical protein [Cellulomonas sp. SG140]